MKIDPKEVAALDAAILNFEQRFASRQTISESDEFVVLVQASKRICNIAKVGDGPITAEPPKPKPKPEPARFPVYLRKPSEKPHNPNVGTRCSRCSSDKIVDKGGGCLKCVFCAFDMGCGST